MRIAPGRFRRSLRELSTTSTSRCSNPELREPQLDAEQEPLEVAESLGPLKLRAEVKDDSHELAASPTPSSSIRGRGSGIAPYRVRLHQLSERASETPNRELGEEVELTDLYPLSSDPL